MNFKNLTTTKKSLFLIALLLPLILGIFSLIYLKFFYATALMGEQLSPVESKPFFIIILLFTFGYAGFLWLMFSDNLREWISKH